MRPIESKDWNGARMRLNGLFTLNATRSCDIRAADPGDEGSVDQTVPGESMAHAEASEALAIAEVLVERKVAPTLAAFLGACLAAALASSEDWLSVAQDTDETMTEWARRLVDTGDGGTPLDDEPSTEKMLASVAWWHERGDPDESTPDDISEWQEMLLARAYGDKWADACAKACGRS